MERFDTTTTTTCGYCGVGCRLEAGARNGRVVSIAPALDGPANRGHTCLKGRFAHQFSRSRERLTTPLLRDGGRLRSATWEEATERIVGELTRVRADHGPDAIAGLASSRATNEDCWAMQRLMRAAIGTNNIDNCSRVCHSPTSYALRRVAGLLRGDRLLRRHRARGRSDHHRRQPHRGSSGRRGADQAGGAARPAARDDRPAAHRAGRLRGAAPRAATGDECGGPARAGARARARGLHRPCIRRGRARAASTRCRS